LRTGSCTPIWCWCSAGCSRRSTCARNDLHDAGISRAPLHAGDAHGLSLIFFVSYILTKASVTIFAGAFAIQTILGYRACSCPLLGEVDFFWFAAFSLVIVTGIFVILGGMKSVLWTEAMHVPVLLTGSIVLLLVGLAQIGGLEPLRAQPETIHSVATALDHARNAGIPGLSVRRRAARHGSACCSLHRSSACGTGVPINTSCNAC
jgi:hypothetical protein